MTENGEYLINDDAREREMTDLEWQTVRITYIGIDRQRQKGPTGYQRKKD